MSDAAKDLTELVTTSAPTASTSVPSYFEALLSSLTISVIIPLLILGLAVWLIWTLLARAQSDADFNISDVLRDETNKVSSDRLLLFASWAVSSWVLAVVVFAMPNVLVEAYVTYLGVWGATSGAKSFFRHKYGVPDGAPTPPEPKP
jgi:hypothetical protein